MRPFWLIALIIISAAVAGCQRSAVDSEFPLYAIWLDGRHHCEGIAVTPYLIATVKHCVFNQYAKVPVVPERLSLVDVKNRSNTITAVYVNSNRYESLADLQGNDIAVLLSSIPLQGVVSVGKSNAGMITKIVLRRDGKATKKDTPMVSLDDGTIFTSAITCIGDSGSPLLNQQNQVVGLASWRTEPDCNSGLSVFTRLDQYQTWIQQLKIDHDG